MRSAELKALATILIVVLAAVGLAAAGSQQGATATTYDIPVYALCIFLTFLVQWVAFIPAYLMQTEKFFDLVGSVSFIGMTVLAVGISPVVDGRSLLLLALVVIWAARLGLFLVRRVFQAGKDGRFDELKTSFIRFLLVWTLQGLWISLTLAAALAAITTTYRRELGLFAVAGGLVWLFGFLLEVVSDHQKQRFRSNPMNAGKFIRSGLWRLSRHPNYLGEIVLWIGVAVITFPILQGWQWVCLISPFFVFLLLTRVSGIPILERRANERWGGQQAYEAYIRETPLLVPWPWQGRG